MCALWLIMGHVCAKAQDNTLFVDEFDGTTKPWITLGGGKLQAIQQSSDLPPGTKGALEFAYTVSLQKQGNKGDTPTFTLLFRPIKPGDLSSLGALQFQAYSDVGAPFAAVLSERGGGRYIQLFWLPPKSWQQITLYPSRFWLSDNKGDPPDPDGKLDLDQVEAIGIVPVNDFVAAFAGTDPQAVGLIQPSAGSHTLLLTHFEALAKPQSEPAPPKFPGEEKGVWIDPLTEDIISWLLVGSQEMAYDVHSPLGGRALRVHYQQGTDHLIFLAHDLHTLDLSTTDRLVFQAAAEKGVRLAVALQMKDGARYYQLVEVPGDSKPTTISLNMGALQPAPDSEEALAHPIDLSKLTLLMLADVSSLFGQPSQSNTLWIGPIRAVAQSLGGSKR